MEDISVDMALALPRSLEFMIAWVNKLHKAAADILGLAKMVSPDVV